MANEPALTTYGTENAEGAKFLHVLASNRRPMFVGKSGRGAM